MSSAPLVPDRLDDKVPFLARLDADARASLLALGTAVQYPARSVVIREGEHATHVLLIMRGWLKVTSSSGTGYEALLALRGPGDIVGETSAVNASSRSATVTALEAVQALSIRESDFTSFLSAQPQAALQLLRLMTGRLVAGDRKRLEYASCTVRQRLARLLLELAASHGEPVPEGVAIRVPLTRSEIAGSVGASREAVTRLLGELRERQIVEVRGRVLIVRQPEKLRQVGAN
ncbi:Crp/Fnr family transcriptional regulator [Kitasatospora sp. NPDC004799]|uniref:Crp/Fnr family transcriptional regulator n=1 Tax=Kitasatospora sp. NPDC004799 TaxID=3154460 RepID=UPI0033AD1D12